MTTGTAAVEDLAHAFAAVGDLIAEIRADQWSDPTPCTEWSVSDVVDHLVGMNLVFVALIEGGPMPERGVDRPGDDPAGAYRKSAAAHLAAFAAPDLLGRSFAGPLGTATGAERLQIRLADLLTHGWDLAQATGIAVAFPDELAERALEFSRDQFVSGPSRIGRFADPQPVAADAPALDRLAAFTGRPIPPHSHIRCVP